MKKFTYGPWYSFSAPNGNLLITPIEDNRKVICSLQTDPDMCGLDKVTQEANARLIVNAFDMYQALNHLCGVWQPGGYEGHILNNAKKIIARI